MLLLLYFVTLRVCNHGQQETCRRKGLWNEDCPSQYRRHAEIATRSATCPKPPGLCRLYIAILCHLSPLHAIQLEVQTYIKMMITIESRRFSLLLHDTQHIGKLSNIYHHNVNVVCWEEIAWGLWDLLSLWNIFSIEAISDKKPLLPAMFFSTGRSFGIKTINSCLHQRGSQRAKQNKRLLDNIQNSCDQNDDFHWLSYRCQDHLMHYKHHRKLRCAISAVAD